MCCFLLTTILDSTATGEWDDLASGYANGFYQLLWPKVTTLLEGGDDVPNAVVVDFGCGTGLLSAKLRSKVASIHAMDVSPKMIDMLQEKIQSQEWTNVQAYTVILGLFEKDDDGGQDVAASVQQQIRALYGTVDVIVASSVLTFIPDEDVPDTMRILGKLLKPGGLLIHSDWPKSEAKHPDAMDTEKAERMYGLAGLRAESMQICALPSCEEVEVFFGVAQKPAS